MAEASTPRQELHAICGCKLAFNQAVDRMLAAALR